MWLKSNSRKGRCVSVDTVVKLLYFFIWRVRKSSVGSPKTGAGVRAAGSDSEPLKANIGPNQVSVLIGLR